MRLSLVLCLLVALALLGPSSGRPSRQRRSVDRRSSRSTRSVRSTGTSSRSRTSSRSSTKSRASSKSSRRSVRKVPEPDCYLVDRSTTTCSLSAEEIFSRMKPCFDQSLLKRIVGKEVRACKREGKTWLAVQPAIVRLQKSSGSFTLDFNGKKSSRKSSSSTSSRKAAAVKPSSSRKRRSATRSKSRSTRSVSSKGSNSRKIETQRSSLLKGLKTLKSRSASSSWKAQANLNPVPQFLPVPLSPEKAFLSALQKTVFKDEYERKEENEEAAEERADPPSTEVPIVLPADLEPKSIGGFIEQTISAIKNIFASSPEASDLTNNNDESAANEAEATPEARLTDRMSPESMIEQAVDSFRNYVLKAVNMFMVEPEGEEKKAEPNESNDPEALDENSDRLLDDVLLTKLDQEAGEALKGFNLRIGEDPEIKREETLEDEVRDDLGGTDGEETVREGDQDQAGEREGEHIDGSNGEEREDEELVEKDDEEREDEELVENDDEEREDEELVENDDEEREDEELVENDDEEREDEELVENDDEELVENDDEERDDEELVEIDDEEREDEELIENDDEELVENDDEEREDDKLVEDNFVETGDEARHDKEDLEREDDIAETNDEEREDEELVDTKDDGEERDSDKIIEDAREQENVDNALDAELEKDLNAWFEPNLVELVDKENLVERDGTHEGLIEKNGDNEGLIQEDGGTEGLTEGDGVEDDGLVVGDEEFNKLFGGDPVQDTVVNDLVEEVDHANIGPVVEDMVGDEENMVLLPEGVDAIELLEEYQKENDLNAFASEPVDEDDRSLNPKSLANVQELEADATLEVDPETLTTSLQP